MPIGNERAPHITVNKGISKIKKYVYLKRFVSILRHLQTKNY